MADDDGSFLDELEAIPGNIVDNFVMFAKLAYVGTGLEDVVGAIPVVGTAINTEVATTDVVDGSSGSDDDSAGTTIIFAVLALIVILVLIAYISREVLG